MSLYFHRGFLRMPLRAARGTDSGLRARGIPASVAGVATITGFHHTAIRSADFDVSVAFYTEALGMRTRITWGEAGKRAVMLDAGDGNYVEIFERAEPAPDVEAAILHFALRTDDCAAMLERVRAAGAVVTMEPKVVTIDSSIGPVPVKIAFFRGPAGELIELFENAIL
jgi:catechol 2,3-dioxygenase-like lactoylglutathione lyase family enzyme